jgi:pyruvate dehydrogenase (quinone)
MATTAADVLIETIQDWGVDVVFGMPGDGTVLSGKVRELL